ncbi:hypothetical protein CPB83DRAFT_855060 [Crepidotus variabilis]|uniref:Uncharacterized protein n=1 Tax=Crepidotus variabilis TaxID=179855 RepID=A0A9P6EFP1_9AGAR|nr:hypothetical protein CPB83DRAFT_855060 [Crepidotus variabilis]
MFKSIALLFFSAAVANAAGGTANGYIGRSCRSAVCPESTRNGRGIGNCVTCINGASIQADVDPECAVAWFSDTNCVNLISRSSGAVDGCIDTGNFASYYVVCTQ